MERNNARETKWSQILLTGTIARLMLFAGDAAELA
jgi:hypothetical protein